MGYVSEYDTEQLHEGYVRMAYSDGKVSSGTSTGAGHYLEGYTYLPKDEQDPRTWGEIDPAFLRPDDQIVGWLPGCECGWRGILAHIQEGSERGEPTYEQEVLLMDQWRLHLRDLNPEAYPLHVSVSQ